MKGVARVWFACGGVSVAIGVGLAAWHAHGLAGRLSPEEWQAFGRGLDQQFLCAVGLLALGLLGERARPRLGLAAGAALLAGMLLFCGSIYLRTAGGWEEATRVAPTGGVLQVIGWLLLAAAGAMGRPEGWSRHPDSNWG